MTKTLEGKVVVITGAGRGIGKAIAVSFAQNGAKTCCLSRTQNEIDKTAELINKNYGEAIALKCDVSNYKEVDEAFNEINKTYGGIDIVVINAGIDSKSSPIDETNSDEWKSIIDVNLIGAYHTAKAATPYLKKRGGGKIITIGSGSGHKGRADSSAYCCSKAGLWMLTRVLSQELQKYNISVNELIPGPVITAMGDNSMKDSQSAFSIEGEWIKNPEDVTDMALFMAMQPLKGPTGQSFSLMRRDI